MHEAEPLDEDADDVLTADVVVLGTGPAGMAAVAAAAADGCEVIAVEALESIGGNCVWSTGYLAFVGSGMQAEQGITDDEETFLADAARTVALAADDYGVVWDEDLVRLFARESAATYTDLVRRGVRFSRFIPRPDQHTIDRMAAVEDPWMFRRAFLPDFERPGVRVLFASTATRLRTDVGGRVTGVSVLQRDADGTTRTRQVQARRGVVLATGGYQSNPRLRLRYQPARLANGPYLGIDTCRGDGHLMGQAVGGDLVNMPFVPPLVIVSSSVVEDAIAVNGAGERFHDEAGPYLDRVRALDRQPGRRGWYVLDATVAVEKAALIAQMPRPPVSADSLGELAALIGVPAAALESTVCAWNEFLDGDAERDPSFGRVVLPPRRRRAERAPYLAVPMVVGVNFCSGGFRVTQSMQFIDVFGAAVPGLYAAGDCVGGLNPISELGGIHISGGFTLGRVAGRSAARADPAGDMTGDHPWAGLQGAFLPSMVDRTLALVPGTGL